MKSRSLALAAVCAGLTLAPVTFSSLASAQPASDDVTTNAARARFKEGVEFYDKGQFENARAAFLQAYALKKHPDILFNLAQSCVKSGHAMEAEHYFQQFLRDAKDIAPAKRADADKGIQEARNKLGRLEINAPAGAEITVDETRAGVAPLSEPFVVEPGPHTVKIKGTDGATDSQSVTASAGQLTQVKFVKAAPTPAPVPTPTPAPTPAPEPVKAEAAPEVTPPKTDAAPNTDAGTSKKNLLSPPQNMVPVYVGGGIAVSGFAVAIIFGILKGNAQDSADDVELKIRNYAQSNGRQSASICSTKTSDAQLTQACALLVDNRDKVDTNALVANIGLGVGIAATLGTVGYYLLAPKEASQTSARRTFISPMIGSGTGGLSLSGSF